MKKLLLPYLAFIVLFLASCQGDDTEKTIEELIIGEWQAVTEDGNPRWLEIEYSQLYAYDNCDLENVYIDYKLEKELDFFFNSDNTFTVDELSIEYKHDNELLFFECEVEYSTSLINGEYEGEYTVDSENNTLTLNAEYFFGPYITERRYNIVSIDENNLEIISNDEYAITLYFVRTN
jgi:hypothetical protein